MAKEMRDKERGTEYYTSIQYISASQFRPYFNTVH
jgi:hypothetical protein